MRRQIKIFFLFFFGFIKLFEKMLKNESIGSSINY